MGMRAGLRVGVGKFVHISARVGKGGQVWMGDVPIVRLWVCVQVYGWLWVGVGEWMGVDMCGRVHRLVRPITWRKQLFCKIFAPNK